ncbi:MAG: hypothetical protein UHN88_04195 [Eubacterium sp.]|nr:hypothetical protein [Eubacterium sp.]
MKKIKINFTRPLNFYVLKFLLRLALVITAFFLYIFHRDELKVLMDQPIWRGITPIHVLWCIFMGIMITHLLPTNILSMALRKSKEINYRPVQGYDELELLRFVQDQNIKAWKVLLGWLSFNAIFGVLYLVGILGSQDLLMLSVFFFLSDYICILFYCPFQSLIMKNKCCVNCRIYDWGHFMMFTPMLFIKNFFSWSLFFTSCIVVLHWEIIYARHPERFWSGSNKTLQCAHCKDKTCQFKEGLKRRHRRAKLG